MRRFALTVVLVLLGTALCRPVSAQSLPRVEVFGGYSYLNVDLQSGVPSTVQIPRQSANGWEASVSGDVHRWFGVEADVAGYYKNASLGTGLPDLHVRNHSFTGGPRLNYRPFFVHALVGGDHLCGSISGVSLSLCQDSFAAEFGGGVVWPVRHRWAVRGSADYVLTHHDIGDALAGLPNQSLTQNNFRASVGIVYILGGIGERPLRIDREKPAAAQCVGSAAVASLGLIGCSSADGFLVTSVRTDSPGAGSGIMVGDVVTEIGDRPVHSATEIDAAIGSHSGIKVSYMIQGKWLAVHEVKLR